MRFFDTTKNPIDFFGNRHIAVGFAIVLTLVAIVSLAVRGLNYGLDFTGGYLIELSYESSVELTPVRGALTAGNFPGASAQHFGTTRDVLIRLAPQDGMQTTELEQQVVTALQPTGKFEVRRVEFVGPQVGEELREQGGLAVVIATFFILVYVAFRFEWHFAVGAIIATMHDVIVTVGVFSLFQIEFDLTVLAAVLAVLGYSLNDTIVVFDRIRENFRKLRTGTPVEVANTSVNETLSRTIMTSFTTLLVVLALFFLGGSVIHGFSLALVVGILIGTYSSIYVASPTILWLGVNKQHLMPPKKEGEEFGRP